MLKELEPQIQLQEVQVKKEYGASSLLLNADPNLLRIVIQNLLTNAVKYTPARGTVSLVVKKQAGDVYISVADTGIGIPKSQQGKIYQKLFRADNAKEKITDGNGLGLYMVKSIVTTHGGRISFESTENVGTTFTVTLPGTGMLRIEGSKTLDL